MTFLPFCVIHSNPMKGLQQFSDCAQSLVGSTCRQNLCLKHGSFVPGVSPHRGTQFCYEYFHSQYTQCREMNILVYLSCIIHLH